MTNLSRRNISLTTIKNYTHNHPNYNAQFKHREDRKLEQKVTDSENELFGKKYRQTKKI